MDVAQLAFAVEDLHGPFTSHAEVTGEVAKELDDLRDVVVVFTVFSTGLGVKEVVAGDELEHLLSYPLVLSEVWNMKDQ